MVQSHPQALFELKLKLLKLLKSCSYCSIYDAGHLPIQRLPAFAKQELCNWKTIDPAHFPAELGPAKRIYCSPIN
jgi:hypothetical protein